jgi:hypothetical protein
VLSSGKFKDTICREFSAGGADRKRRKNGQGAQAIEATA